MQDSNRRMYELEYPAPIASSANANEPGPTMIVALHGYADAGNAVEASSDHLKAALENTPVASFNNDELIDYRARRPAVTIEHNAGVDIEPIELGIRALRDTSGKSFLLLSGPEPDMRWEAFTGAVADIAEKFNVKDTICLYAAPMPVPHTRPMVVTAHGTSKALTERMVRMDSTMLVPGSASLFLERELAKRGRSVAGYTAHVPHYLAASSYPLATFQLLESVSTTAELQLPLGSLRHDIERIREQLNEQVNESGEIMQVVNALEEQYDAFLERYRSEHPQAIMPGEENSPTGEELGEEFQKFLQELSEPGLGAEEFLSMDIDDREDNFGENNSSPAGSAESAAPGKSANDPTNGGSEPLNGKKDIEGEENTEDRGSKENRPNPGDSTGHGEPGEDL